MTCPSESPRPGEVYRGDLACLRRACAVVRVAGPRGPCANRVKVLWLEGERRGGQEWLPRAALLEREAPP